MTKKIEKIITEGGINGTGKRNVKWTTREVKEIKAAVKKQHSEKTPEQKIELEIFSLILEMKNYLANEESKNKITAGDFLKRFIKTTGKKNKIFAKYIDLEESNLSSIISGRRKINISLALKLEQIFGVNPSWWFEIQLKNEFLNLKEKKKKTSRKKYSLKGLLKKVS